MAFEGGSPYVPQRVQQLEKWPRVDITASSSLYHYTIGYADSSEKILPVIQDSPWQTPTSFSFQLMCPGLFQLILQFGKFLGRQTLNLSYCQDLP